MGSGATEDWVRCVCNVMHAEVKAELSMAGGNSTALRYLTLPYGCPVLGRKLPAGRAGGGLRGLSARPAPNKVAFVYLT